MYFQNPFFTDFQGILPLSDRQYSTAFKIKGNTNNPNEMTTWNSAPYNLSAGSSQVLKIWYSFDGKNYTPWSLNVVNPPNGIAAVNSSAVTASEVAAALNSDPTFNVLFIASTACSRGINYVLINSIQKTRGNWQTYVDNSGAEMVMRFNKKAGVAELPSYFVRHTITNANNYPDSNALLIQLDPTTPGQPTGGGGVPSTTAAQQIISEAGFAYPVGLTNGSAVVTMQNVSPTIPFAVGDSVVVYNSTTTVNANISTISSGVSLTLTNNWSGTTGAGSIIDIHADWQLIHGRSGLFNFQNITVTGGSLISRIIEYGAGAVVGDFARRIDYLYAGTSTQPYQITEIPHVLTGSDLIVPPIP